jgi:hypothetical protein
MANTGVRSFAVVVGLSSPEAPAPVRLWKVTGLWLCEINASPYEWLTTRPEPANLTGVEPERRLS